jgi:serine O-acetyltransferase
MPATTVSEIVRRLTSRATGVSCPAPLPSAGAVADLLETARRLLFPQLFVGEIDRIDERMEEHLEHFRDGLRRQVQRALACAPSDESRPQTAEEVSRRIVARLPMLQEMLEADVDAAMDGDPALHSAEEAVLSYPGVAAVICFRLAHELYTLGVPLLPRMITEHAHSRTGIDIHPGALIGRRFFIDHGTGVVIGGTAVIGDGVRLYQGVTLGAKSFPVDSEGRVIKGLPRHPILEDDVVVYSGASILGRITIGRGAMIGGNVWVTRDVPAGARVTQARPRQVEFSHGGGI